MEIPSGPSSFGHFAPTGLLVSSLPAWVGLL